MSRAVTARVRVAVSPTCMSGHLLERGSRRGHEGLRRPPLLVLLRSHLVDQPRGLGPLREQRGVLAGQDVTLAYLVVGEVPAAGGPRRAAVHPDAELGAHAAPAGQELGG